MLLKRTIKQTLEKKQKIVPKNITHIEYKFVFFLGGHQTENIQYDNGNTENPK